MIRFMGKGHNTEVYMTIINMIFLLHQYIAFYQGRQSGHHISFRKYNFIIRFKIFQGNFYKRVVIGFSIIRIKHNYQFWDIVIHLSDHFQRMFKLRERKFLENIAKLVSCFWTEYFVSNISVQDTWKRALRLIIRISISAKQSADWKSRINLPL